MIQANELRIGNYYMYAGNDGIVYAKVNTIQYNQFGLLSDCDGVNFGICAPIPITEEWLLKFGFKKDEFILKFSVGLFWCINNCDDSFYIDFDEDFRGFYIGLNGYGYLKNINHIHELQNLYFALTNKELNI